MMSMPTNVHLKPVGYLLVRDPEEARSSSPYRMAFGRYCGVDRLPPLFPPDQDIRRELAIPPIQQPRLLKSLDDWWDTRSGRNAFIPNGQLADRFFRDLQTLGPRLELVYCEVVWGPGEPEPGIAYQAVEGERPAIAMTYGLDVSWPSCTHSAIVQPGVVPNNPSWRGRLNEHGLLSNYRDAAVLREEYLRIYPYPPFDVYLVHRIGVRPAKPRS